MLGSYGPHPKSEPYAKDFEPEESPSGMMARGKYAVRSRVVDDDGEVFAGMCLRVSNGQNLSTLLDWDWSFEIAKEW